MIHSNRIYRHFRDNTPHWHPLCFHKEIAMSINLSFNDQVVLVTGASSGIGKATAEAFAKAGARVVLADIQAQAGKALESKMQSEGLRAQSLACDVSKTQEVVNLFDQIRSQYGRIDVAFNNAGTEGKPGAAADSTYDEVKKTLDINFFGVFSCMKEEIQIMTQQGGGIIINCSSIAGIRGFPNAAAYVASKHAVIGLTRAAALDYADKKIRINAICPGVILTPMIERATAGSSEAQNAYADATPMKRLGQPEEIAAAVLWLASPGASYTTGTELVVDGGWCAR